MKHTENKDILFSLFKKSSDEEEQPCSLIRGGENFWNRFQAMLAQHYDEKVEGFDISTHPKIPESYLVNVSTSDWGPEEFVLLRCWEY
jgi:hypothetical protein